MVNITNINFNSLDDLLDFILNIKEFNEWETVIFRMATANGIEMNINTKINDATGARSFIQFKKLKNMLQAFYTQNSYSAINLEIKLKFPELLQYTIDSNNLYEAFYIDFYSDQLTSFFTLSFVEKTKDFDAGPVQSWIMFITNIYNYWIDTK